MKESLQLRRMPENYSSLVVSDESTILIQVASVLAPTIRSCLDEIDATRQLLEGLIERLGTAGMFRLFVPAEFAGPVV